MNPLTRILLLTAASTLLATAALATPLPTGEHCLRHPAAFAHNAATDNEPVYRRFFLATSELRQRIADSNAALLAALTADHRDEARINALDRELNTLQETLRRRAADQGLKQQGWAFSLAHYGYAVSSCWGPAIKG